MEPVPISCECGKVLDIPRSVWVEVQTCPGPCAYCGEEGDAPGHRAKVIFPRAWVGESCYARDPRAVWESAERHTCAAQVNLKALSGCIVAHRPTVVAEGEFWLRRGDGLYLRHKLLPDGNTKPMGQVRTKT